MGQVTIYLEEEVELRMVKAAQSEQLSKSKWIARLIKAKVSNEWPKSVSELAGSWSDFPEAKELRANLAEDVKREIL